MSIDTTPTRRGSGGSPFLTVGAAARLAGLTPATLLRRLGSGDLPGYRLGRRWFVPEAEFRRHLRRRAWMAQTDAAPELARELTRALPTRLGIDDLERFFGLRRPVLYEVLGVPHFGGIGPRKDVMTIGVLQQLLRGARNACAPCPEPATLTASAVA
ncbi:helix-turn-helix domain-containing protein [Microbacterium cremeum]|uniref:helix-turn-helix domain-containing protein n=1 Tax=Microbacterium cremeum TaxID=2782169 RepID=UPI0018882375|nr:helix-turn-helix domain-containing protein [Microbacterium cremeum]